MRDSGRDFGRRLAGRHRSFIPAMPPRHRQYTGLQFADAERLGQVVVGAALEADHRIGFAVAGGEHENGRRHVRAGGPQGATDRDAVEAGQHHIEHQQVESCSSRQIERGTPVGFLLDVEPRRPRCS
jgi:hypothetical protein